MEGENKQSTFPNYENMIYKVFSLPSTPIWLQKVIYNLQYFERNYLQSSSKLLAKSTSI